MLAETMAGFGAAKLLIVVALIACNVFFVVAEFVFVRIRATQLDPLVAKGDRRALAARQIVTHLDRYLGATQLAITLVGLGMGAVVEPIFQTLLDPVFDALGVESVGARKGVSIGFGFFVNSYLLIVVGELAPKALAIRQTLPLALLTAQPVVWFYRMAFPFVWLLNASARRLLALLGVKDADEDQGHSEEEMRLMLASSRRGDGDTGFGHDLVLNALDLRQRTARDVMRPRQEIVGLSTRQTIAECRAVAERTRYSRFPLCENGDLDRTLGVVHFKDLFAQKNRAASGADLLPVARKLLYVPETARLEGLLGRFLEQKGHFAVVVDEYGGTTGIVTLENILEELVGQIQDEFDQEKPLSVQIGPDLWEVDGAFPLRELAEMVGEELEAEDVTTTSGWLTQKLGEFPQVGREVKLATHLVRVEQTDGPRVTRVRVERTVPLETEDEAG